ncbi:MAG: phospho-sugar mutase [Acidobacteria bacterium]|nr:phospho-sugar mutase [Acidobacteriota bacterium]
MSLDPANLLDQAREGFETVRLAPEIRQNALRRLQEWLETDKFAGLLSPSDYQPLLARLIADGKWDFLVDSFYQTIPFGTGGRRGPVGVGPNRINPFTIASSVQGHVEYLRQYLPAGEEMKVVVAYDVRQYKDIRAVYPPEVSNPLQGLTSKDLAQTAAAVYCAAGVRVYMLPDEPADYISTPELSFLIRRFGAHGGLNTSASHNHPDDNGGKFYNGQGGQEIPPNDEKMVEIVERITEIHSMPYADARASGLITDITAEDRQAYVDLNLSLRTRPDAGPAKIVFTGLHGTGVNTVGRCLQAMGFVKDEQYFEVPEQREFRGDFANVKFRSPNPEVPQSLDLAEKRAAEVGADLILATDPDADRLGGCSRSGDGYMFLNGNEFASILTRYLLEKRKQDGTLPAVPLVIKTQVTTELITRITESYGGVVIGDLLVGFKYIGHILAELEEHGGFQGVEASLSDFILGTEESHGLLLTPEIRDKDAAGAGVALACLASDLKEKGLTIADYLVDTYKRYGYHRNYLRSTIMQGAAGTAAIQKIQNELRANPPQEIGGYKVERVVDYFNTAPREEGGFGPFVSGTDQAGRNLMVYFLEGGLKATIRPSGTEPKNKIYLEMPAAPLGAEATDEEFEQAKAATDEKVRDFSNAFLKKMLAIVGIELPEYALAISDLVALDRKRHFAEKFIPELVRKSEALVMGEGTAEEVGTWIDQELASYGADARLLVEDGFRAWLKQARAEKTVAAATLVFAEQVFGGE